MLFESRNPKLENNLPITKASLGKEMLLEVVRLIKLFYTIPVTTFTAERTFSAFRRLKTYLRITMSQARLNHAMCTRTERTDIINFIIAQCKVAGLQNQFSGG